MNSQVHYYLLHASKFEARVMSNMTVRISKRVAHQNRSLSAADKLIRDSLAAQTQLVGNGVTHVIPAIAESPIPVLDLRNRTPDPRSRLPQAKIPLAKRA
ncbi:hypothetical protein [Paracoccus aestuariivivens]|uniref:Uncharacterized protein n=1 Tax=Paracoccus aestuariivivens TaxID=1820333 RepID=A0A6L6JAW4_9RHOB|nr:hypothetical protein [Paracoccus aestuariivivens]MTH77787.1 hypothetical protein [Paracoccus aestuariivivens]